MFDVPGSDICAVHIDDEVVRGDKSSHYVYNSKALDEQEVSEENMETEVDRSINMSAL